jgi:hypothetical protein
MSIKNPVTRITTAALSAILLSAAMTGVAEATNLRTGFDSNTLARNDDSSTGAVDLGFVANFFGNAATGQNVYEQVYVNNNGNLTFGRGLSTFTPFGLTGNTSIPIIAAFFADVDTRNPATSPVTYGRGTVDGRNAFGANYRNVGYFSNGADKINDFQIVLIDRANTGAGNFDIEFNYDQIQWETGAASGGSGGLGGRSARIGFSNGTGNEGSFFEVCGSGINGAFLDGAARVSCGTEPTLDGGLNLTALDSAATVGSNISSNLFNTRSSTGAASPFTTTLGGRLTTATVDGIPTPPPIVIPPTDPNEPTSTSPTTGEPTSTSPTTDVPEPADMLGTALAGLALVGLKRKMSKKAKL